MSKSNYLENKILDHVYGGGDYSRPTTIYFAAFTSAPSDTGGGTEVTGGAYARVAVTNNSTNFPAAASGVKSNDTLITWLAATADWGTVVAIATFDALTSGNMLHWASGLSAVINNRDTLSIPVGDFDVTED